MKQKPRQATLLLGIDTGGTFTDFVLVGADGDIRTHKLLSTPAEPARSILQGIADLGVGDAMAEGRLRIIHGTTIATNAALERKGVPTALICNRGFRDLLTIGRQARPALYQLEFDPIEPPLPRRFCLEVDVRTDASGRELRRLEPGAISLLQQQLAELGVEAVAINLLFSFLDDSHERALEAALGDRYFCSRSSAVLPESGEYERGIATWLNAWLGPLVARYLLQLQRETMPSRFSVMQSSGSSIAADQAAQRAVNLLLSGPAGGVRAAGFVGEACQMPRLITFDMGGTSTDVALIDDQPELTREGHIGSWPLAVPMLNIHTIGAGGGSIASLDAGGLLRVGPDSAGADPGPACYRRGGLDATVTDANLVLGRLQADRFLDGRMQLDTEAARTAVGRLADAAGLDLEQAALGIVRIANEHMADALRLISLRRGHDPRDFGLCCFGGAGGLHVCALAEALDMDRILLPAHAGVLSALGMLATAPGRQRSQSWLVALADVSETDIESRLRQLEHDARRELEDEGVEAGTLIAEAYLELRYRGQRHTLSVPWQSPDAAAEAFRAKHRQRYGHLLQAALELVSLRVDVHGQAPLTVLPALPAAAQPEPVGTTQLSGFAQPVPVFERIRFGAGAELTGPALIVEQATTILLHDHWQLRCDEHGHLHAARLPETQRTSVR